MLCAYTRPRYQVSVYRTIGPLVSYLHVMHISHLFARISLKPVGQS